LGPNCLEVATFFFFFLPRGNAVTHPRPFGRAGYVGLALFNGPYPLKPLGMSGSGVMRAGRDLEQLHDYPTCPPPEGGCFGCTIPSCPCGTWAMGESLKISLPFTPKRGDSWYQGQLPSANVNGSFAAPKSPRGQGTKPAMNFAGSASRGRTPRGRPIFLGGHREGKGRLGLGPFRPLSPLPTFFGVVGRAPLMNFAGSRPCAQYCASFWGV